MKLWICRDKYDTNIAAIFAGNPDWGHFGWRGRNTWACIEVLERWLGQKLPPWPELLEINAPKPEILCTWIPNDDTRT